MRRVRVLEDRLGSEHPLVARNLSNLGVLFYRLNRCKKAEPLIRRARAILEKTYGTENALAASALTKLATVYSEFGDYTRAEPMFLRALATLETLRADDGNVAAAYKNLGWLYPRRGDYLQAETYGRRALEGMEKVHEPDHPEVARALRVYAAVLRKERRGAEAKKLEKRAALIEQRHSRENLMGLTVDARVLR
jgi:tetratricopeptide (TPR) repeat protein